MVLDVEIRVDLLKEFFEVISLLNDEVLLHFKEEGVESAVVDPSHVAMIYVTLSKDAFNKYECSGVKIGVDMEKINSFLKIIGSSEMLQMKLLEEDNMLLLKGDTLTKKISLIDPSAFQESKLPQLAHSVKITVSSKDLERGIKAGEKFTEQLSFILTEDGFSVFGRKDNETINLDIPKSQLLALEGDIDGEIRSTFSMEFLSKISKVLTNSETVELKLKTNYPLEMAFQIADGYGNVIFLLAPRMED